MHKASQVGNLRVCKLLMDYDADVNKQDSKKQTPLWIAAKEGHEDICNELIQKDAFVNAKDEIGRTPFFIAFRKRHENVCKMLIHNGANTNINEVNGIDIYFEEPLSERWHSRVLAFWENEDGKLLKRFT